jgi:hypothetical protein
MGFYWQTQIYFETPQDWESGFFESVMQAVGQMGLEFSIDPSTGLGSWFGPDSGPSQKVDFQTAMGLIEQHRGGDLHVYNRMLDLRGDLSIYQKRVIKGRENHADAAFTNLNLYVPGVDLIEDIDTLSEQKFMFVFQVSLVLAKLSKALYGVGDLESSNWGNAVIEAKDIIDHRIPRLGWWNYFGKGYDPTNEYGRFATSSHWLSRWTPEGAAIFITRPPVGSLHPNIKFDV